MNKLKPIFIACRRTVSTDLPPVLASPLSYHTRPFSPYCAIYITTQKNNSLFICFITCLSHLISDFNSIIIFALSWRFDYNLTIVVYTKQDWHILLEKPVLDVQTNNTSGQIKWVVTTVGSEAIKKLKIKYGKVRVYCWPLTKLSHATLLYRLYTVDFKVYSVTSSLYSVR